MDASMHIEAFVRDLSRERRRSLLLEAVLGASIWLAPPVLVLWIVWPESIGWALVVGGALLLARVGWVALRHQLWLPLPSRGRFPLLPVDRGLGLGDRLATWHTLRETEPMGAWLEEDLARDLEAVADEDIRGLWGRRLKRLLRWVPLILLLLLLKLFAPWLPGIRDRGGVAPAVTEETSEKGGGDADRDSEDPEPGTAEERGDPEQGPDEGERPRPPQPQQEQPLENSDNPGEPPLWTMPPPPEDPIDESLGRQEEFVVPDFVGEGESRTEKVRQAMLEQGVAPPPAGSRGAGGLPDDPEARARELERAAENAVRSRHVPEREREFVRRWFDRVRREAAPARAPQSRRPG